MKHRTLDEMITYFNQQLSEMDIDRKYKIQLLGMITAIGFEAQERKWIPCSERLPEEGRYVLCSQSNGDVGEGKLLQDSCGEWLILYDNLIVDDGEVIAWMPLPEPYQEVEHD